MKNTELVQSARKVHEKQLIEELDAQVQEQLKAGVPSSVADMASQLIAQSELANNERRTAENVTPMKRRSKTKEQLFIGQFELLAASSESNDRLWYEQTLIVNAPGNKGSYKIEVVPFLNDEKNVSITIEPSANGNNEVKHLLGSYSSQSIGMSILCDGQPLLNAEINVSSDACSAEGVGKVLEIKRPPNKVIEVKIDTDND